MPTSAGNFIFGTDGSSYRLSKEIGRGGQGAVWALDGHPKLVAKFYHSGIKATDRAKLEAMCKLKTEALGHVSAWPLTLLTESKTGKPQGLLMRRIIEHQSVNQVYAIKSRLRAFPEAQFPFLLHTAMNISRAFATIHDAGQVIGDVNHSNLMVSQSATVSMIDCDSFQISDGQKIYPCPVGVPEFTPPELQGVNFEKHFRTQQHDAFGLAVLIFYMLFIGRHPFMGAFDVAGGDIMSLEHAIGSYKFPYALDPTSPEVRLPSFGPHLSDYPVSIVKLFKRAFTREALILGRPSAHEWVSVLSSLAISLKQCQSNPNHHYFSSLSNCPWCRVEGGIGMPIFGIKLSVIQDQSFNLIAIWAQITDITPDLEELTAPDLSVIGKNLAPDSAIPQIVRQRRVFRLWSISVIMLLSFFAVEFLPVLLAVFLIGGALFAGRRIWKKGAALAAEFDTRYSVAKSTYELAQADVERSRTPPEQFKKEKERLESTKRDYEALPSLKAKKLAALQSSRELKQRQHFLEKFRLEDERIPNIGPKNKSILYTFGILDAWDVNSRAITQIKGFGPVKRDSLLAWRADKERQFRFDSTQPVDPRDLRALEQEFAQKTQDLQKTLNAGPNALRQAISVWRAQRRQQMSKLWSEASRLAKAEMDKAALRRF